MKKPSKYALTALFVLGFASIGAESQSELRFKIAGEEKKSTGISAEEANNTVPSLQQNQINPPVSEKTSERPIAVAIDAPIAKPIPPAIQAPQIVPAPSPAIIPVAQPVQVTTQLISVTQQPIANLSPKTQSLLKEVGAGIGSDNSEPENISIKRGQFAEEAAVEEKKDTGLQEVDAKHAADQPFQIEVSSDKPPAINVYELLKKANRAADVGQYESAIAIYQSILAEEADNRDAIFGAATAYQKSGQRNRAKELYSQLLATQPNYQPALNNLLALAAEEAPEQALLEFAAIEGRNPDFAGVYAQKAKVYRKTLNLPMAIKNLKKAVELDSENQSYRYNLAITEDENQNYANAIKLYAELIRLANNGVEIPVDKEIIVERMNYIGSLN